MPYRPAVAGAFVTLLTLGVAGGPPARAADAAQAGRPLYLRYCSPCHGPLAKGDGAVAPSMRLQPPDLTLLATQSGGEFPLERVVRTIDGREAPRAHGEPAMPVWGRVLSEELGSGIKQRPPIERRVQGSIFSIAEYLRTIQVE